MRQCKGDRYIVPSSYESPRCIPGVSTLYTKGSPRCITGVSTLYYRGLHVVYQGSPRCITGVSTLYYRGLHIDLVQILFQKTKHDINIDDESKQNFKC